MRANGCTPPMLAKAPTLPDNLTRAAQIACAAFCLTLPADDDNITALRDLLDTLNLNPTKETA